MTQATTSLYRAGASASSQTSLALITGSHTGRCRCPTPGNSLRALVPYSCRHGYAHRAHVICDLPPKVVAAAMGHSVQTHLAAYSRWCGDDVVDVAFMEAAKKLELLPSLS